MSRKNTLRHLLLFWHLFDPSFGVFYQYPNKAEILSFSELIDTQKEVQARFPNTWNRVQLTAENKRLNYTEPDSYLYLDALEFAYDKEKIADI